VFQNNANLLHSLQGSCAGQDKFAASVVLEGLRPQRVVVDIVNDHDVFVAKAGDLWELPCLIGVHCLLKLVDANKYILFCFHIGVGWECQEIRQVFSFWWIVHPVVARACVPFAFLQTWRNSVRHS
jgi:hypothetical protein